MDALATIVEEEVTQAGAFPLGFLFASVKNIGDTPAMVNGVLLPAGQAKGYPFTGKPYNSINYDPMNSTLQIMYTL